MLIIVDTQWEETPDSLILNDDGTGSDIQIPTVMITKDDGDIILNYLQSNS